MADPTADKKTYKSTLNLPQTSFAMKANLVQNEPASLKRWQEQGLYASLREARKDSPRYVFHDGPPYANGSIHLGHLLNKVLKDIVVRSRSMMGFDVPYTPGWDCHGLPIEHKVVEQLGDKAREMVPMQIRKRCQDYANKFIKLQSAQMQRLLTLADYDKPYLTMDSGYEASVLDVFADLVGEGLIYRDLKPVHWSIANRTALADAELEYYDRQDTSVYVLFEVENKKLLFSRFGCLEQIPDNEPVYLMIWTTTPWTLPANLAVAVNSHYSYGLYRVTAHDGRVFYAILAVDLHEQVFKLAGAHGELIGGGSGRDLADTVSYYHPFLNDGRKRLVVTAEYVTLEDGTGLVHTAPGHGTEDYQTGKANGLDIYCPVKEDGTFDDTAPDWLRAPGVDVWKANDLVVQKLRESGHLFHDHVFTHSYPHDWRGKTPIIFRATEQWFAGVNRPYTVSRDATRSASMRDRALDATAQDVKFIPEWGRNRMRGMLESRPDWCLSRQRAWGLPIPAFFSENGEYLLTAASVRAVAQVVREKGSDAWFQLEVSDLLAHYDVAADPDAPAWARSAIANHPSAIKKSTDIFDVWFDSGCSWSGALQRMQGDFPADLYLEGSDQHRGWFQVSLLCALGSRGVSPFKAVLTHGFMVDKDGKKMSKSLGNTLEVDTLLKDFGADVCRWWVSSLNTDNDIKVDQEFFKTAGEEYRKVRNTLKFLLSNLSDLDTANLHTFTSADAASIDAWALGELNELIEQSRRGYDEFHFRRIHEAIFNFCNDTMSAIYLAATKDRLYCDKSDSPRRRRTQTAMYHIVDALIRLVAPILPHTADEAWSSLHGKDAASVHLQLLPQRVEVVVAGQWAGLMTQRDGWLKSIEDARQSMNIDNPLDCGLAVPDADNVPSRFDPVDLADLCGISRVQIAAGDVQVLDLRAEPRCERSWKRDGTVKQRSDGGWLSDRDAAALALA